MIRNKTLLLLTSVFLFFQVNVIAQQSINRVINWHESNDKSTVGSFSNAYQRNNSSLPYYSDYILVKDNSEIRFSVASFESEAVILPEELSNLTFPKEPQITSSIVQERTSFKAAFSFLPFIKNYNTGKIERITSITLTYKIESNPFSVTRGGPEFKNSSVLKDGSIYKLGISESGMYRIDYNFLTENDIDPSSLDPKKIQLFGNPGGMNPEANSDMRFDDIIENAIFIQGEEDGSFDENDYILFFAHGPHSYDGFEFTYNIYEDKNYYFLKVDGDEGKRVKDRATTDAPEYRNTFHAIKWFEKDEYNLLADFSATQGSGQRWFSEKLKAGGSLDLSNFFSDPEIDITEPVKFNLSLAGRSANSSRMSFYVDDNKYDINFSKVSTSRIESTYADLETRSYELSIANSAPKIEFKYENASGDADAWIDYVRMEYARNITLDSKPIIFKHREDQGQSTFGYEIAGYEDNQWIWDVTDPENILNQEISNSRFGYAAESVREFVLFNPEEPTGNITSVEKISNQNLHGITNADLLIIYHPKFESAAKRLAAHRADFSDMNVVTVSIEQVYNEFSSGRVDVPGIRNFARMLYLRDPNFTYLTLFGDGTYDYKYMDTQNSDDNYIPVFQTENSLHPINAFPTDDFFALLDEQEGDDLKGGLDIAVGRIPAKTIEEANVAVDKIIAYDTDPDRMEDWRLRIGFAADDEDNNVHFRDADEIAEQTRNKYENFNVEKIYFDAFPQVSTPGGERYPQATEALYNNLFKGMLTLCYLGHGGPKGWAQERVLKREDVAGWNNTEKLPLMVTATCSFTGFDNPAEQSAGETIFFEKEGGAIGLMSTVRAVYVNRNKQLTESVFDTIYSKVDGVYPGIGEILRRAKNSNPKDTVDVNARKFLLIGDPALSLAIPKNNIYIDVINGKRIDQDYEPDTIRSLQKMSFEGYVADADGQIISDFNGIVNASVFDKLIQAKTLGNNSSSSSKPFNLQKTVLYKGQSEVINGRFSFEFYIPADINFTFGKGKISLYAENGESDASGRFDNFIIGGSSEGIVDDTPPLVDIFLNDEDFVFGGISNSEPVLIAKLSDDFGINVSGVSVGHDLVATLDDNSSESYILNDFYEADLNDFRKGTVRFPLNDLEPGRHTLKIKAWDLSNNPGEGYTEFIVVDDLSSGLENVLNYPNPFSTRTTFQFEHSLPGTELEILIHIYNMSGQLVKTIEHITIDDGFRINDISWDGRDDYGEKIANGVYLYKINVRANQLGISKESNYEKLVILK